MGFLTDAPRSVNRMIVVMRDLGQYRYDVADVFRDFVDYATACFLLEGDAKLAAALKDKYGGDYAKFQELHTAWILTMRDHFERDVQWFDALGTVYEYIASQSKKSFLGQFFTPEPVCDLMTQITHSGEKIEGKRVNDPACGSGRTLLSFNAFHPGNYLFAEDLDPICAKMAAVNMAMHGCQGQVTCMNTISQQFFFCYEVNHLHRAGFPPIPHLVPVAKENCFSLMKRPAEPAPEPEPALFQPQLFDLEPISAVAHKSETITHARPKKATTPSIGQLTIF